MAGAIIPGAPALAPVAPAATAVVAMGWDNMGMQLVLQENPAPKYSGVGREWPAFAREWESYVSTIKEATRGASKGRDSTESPESQPGQTLVIGSDFDERKECLSVIYRMLAFALQDARV